MAPDPAEQVAPFRYRVTAEALSERLSPARAGTARRRTGRPCPRAARRQPQGVQPGHLGPLDPRLPGGELL